MAKKMGMVWYLNLSNEQIDEINSVGWSSEIGGIYLKAQHGKGEAIKAAKAKGLYVKVALVQAEDAEDVWTGLQNIDYSWHSLVGSGRSVAMKLCAKAPGRSMDVGDIIVWEDGKVEVVASIGFEEVAKGDWDGHEV